MLFKKLILILFFLTIPVAYADEAPIPTCVNGKWQIHDGHWTIIQSNPCQNTSEIQPYIIHGKYTNTHGQGLRYTMTIQFFDVQKQIAVTIMSHAYVPWGQQWTGNRRASLAYCPSATGLTGLMNCPIVIPS